MNPGEDVDRREPSYTVGVNVSWYSHYEEQYRGSLNNAICSHMDDLEIVIVSEVSQTEKEKNRMTCLIRGI